MTDIHTSAAALILAAAEKSGLLRDVAAALRCSADTQAECCNSGLCLACGVLEELVEAFEEHCGWPGYDFYGEGFCIPAYSDAELQPYLPPVAGHE